MISATPVIDPFEVIFAMIVDVKDSVDSSILPSGVLGAEWRANYSVYGEGDLR